MKFLQTIGKSTLTATLVKAWSGVLAVRPPQPANETAAVECALLGRL